MFRSNVCTYVSQMLFNCFIHFKKKKKAEWVLEHIKESLWNIHGGTGNNTNVH